MPLYNEGFGSALGDALGGFTTQYVGTQNTLKQQDQQRQQQEADNLYRQQQAAEQRRQYETTRLDNKDVNDKNLGQQALTNRSNDYRTIVAPQMDSYMKDLDAEAAKYAPTLANGAPNPQYSASLYEGAKTRAKAAQKAWNDLTLTVTSGQGYDEAKTNLLHMLGGNATGAAAPAPMDYSFPPAAAPTPAPPVQTTVARGDAMANGDTAPQGPPSPAAATPAPAALPADVRSIPASQLVDLPDDQLLARYGQGGLEYATAARTQYKAQQAAARTLVIKAQNSMWADAIKNLTNDKEHPATPEQLQAAQVLTTYGAFMESGQTLTPEQQQTYNDAVTALAPAVYTAATWQKVLDTKDPAIIAGSYATYQKVAPNVVAGFDVTPFATAVTDAHNAAVADIELKGSTTKKNNTDGIATAETTEIKRWLGGASSLDELIKNGNYALLRIIADNPKALDYFGITDGGTGLNQLATNMENAVLAGTRKDDTQADQNVAQTAGIEATTKKTVADTLGSKTDEGLKLLGQLATLPPDLSYDQIGKQYPGAVARLKSLFGMNDVGAMNLLRSAQYKYGLGLRGDELTNDFKQSQIQTDGAQRGSLLASTTKTEQDTSLRAVLGGAASLDDVIAAKNTATLRAIAADHNAKVLLRITDGGTGLVKLANQIDAQTDATKKATDASAYASTQSGNNSAASATETTQLLPGKKDLQQSTLKLNAAQIGNMASEVTSRNRRDQAYIDSVANTGKVDVARIKQITTDTALTQLKIDHPELFKSSGQPGDPMDALRKRAALNYNSADEAARQAGLIQTQINSMQPKVDVFGNVVGTPPDPVKLAKLKSDLTRLTQRALNQRALGDKVITEGLPGVIAPKTDTGGTGKQAVTFQQLGGELGLPTARRATPYGQMYTINGRPQKHNGEDIFAPVGTPIKAPFTGYVSVKHDLETGNELILTDASGQKMLLGHLQGYAPGLQDAITKAGGRLLVQAGKPVGYVGQTGTAAQAKVPNNSHTHVMAYDASGKEVDPLSVKFTSVQGPGPTQTASKAPPTTPVKVSTGVPLPPAPPATTPAASAPIPTPKGSVGAFVPKLTSSGWFKAAANARTAADADLLLDRAAKMLLPNGEPAQIAVLKRDLAQTMEW